MKKGNLCALPIVILLACFFSLSAQTSQPATGKLDATVIYERAIVSVVQITTANSSGQVFSSSGVIVRSDGVIATNFHVIADAVSAQVKLRTGDIYDDVAILETDERKDLALLQIKAMSLPALTLSDSDAVKVGQTIYALGAPRGLEGTLSPGIVSSIRPGAEVDQSLAGFRVIQFTAPISPGNSGGPLLDETAKVTGLAFITRVDGQNLNFAVPANYLAPLVAGLKGAQRSLARMPKLTEARADRAASVSRSQAAIDDLAGTYTGTWASEQYVGSGTLVMSITVVGGQLNVQLAFTGSEYFNSETLITRAVCESMSGKAVSLPLRSG